MKAKARDRPHRRFLWLYGVIALLLALTRPEASTVLAQPNLTIEPLTWNVVGLDSNNVAVGPNVFPVGARVCNTGDEAATNVSSMFIWDSSDPYINLRSGSLAGFTGANAVPSLAPGGCHAYYYDLEITRESNAYGHTRLYHITASADGVASVTSPIPREIFVESLISQNRNSITSVELDGIPIPPGGTMALRLGQTYSIELIGRTATNGYNQIETFLSFPNSIFQILSVRTSYSADSSPYVDNPSNKLYGDGCLWDSDPTSSTYRSCIGVDGKVGGVVAVLYQVRIVGGVGSTVDLDSLIYDFSGSSYHYNTDFGASRRFAVIIDPALPTFTKSFSPSTASTGTLSRLTFVIQNSGLEPINDVSFTDNLPSTPSQLVVADPADATTSGCGTPVFSPSPGDGTLSFSNGSIPGGGTCTIGVDVTSSEPGTYFNTSGPLLIGTTNTLITASDALTLVEVASLAAPETGFAPEGQSVIPSQPASAAHKTYDRLWLTIPAIRLRTEIVGIPLQEDGWQLTWLQDQAGYLEGTAFPTWPGNSVITGHANLPSGNSGPFARLAELSFGDRVIVTAWGNRYIYEVRENLAVRPRDPSIFRHEDRAWLSLLTCQGYETNSRTYEQRRLIRAVLVEVTQTLSKPDLVDLLPSGY